MEEALASCFLSESPESAPESAPPPGTSQAAADCALFARAAFAESAECPAVRGVLVHGAHGTGKTSLAKWLGPSLGVWTEWISGPIETAGEAGNFEKELTLAFGRARAKAPCLIVMEHVEFIGPPGEGGLARRMGSALRRELQRLRGSRVFVLATSLVGESELARGLCVGPDRIARVYALGPLDAASRLAALRHAIQKEEIDLGEEEKWPPGDPRFESLINEMADHCRGYTLGDMTKLARSAKRLARKGDDEKTHFVVGRDHLFEATTATGASSRSGEDSALNAAEWLKREDLAADRSLDLAGAEMERRRSALREATLLPLLSGEALRLRPGCGAVIHGETGTGKSCLAKSIAREALNRGIAVLQVSCGALLQSTLGASERNVRTVLSAAREQSPCVVLLDQLEMVGAPRGNDTTSEGSLDRILGTILIEMDGVHRSNQVSFIATTTRLADLDEALLRPGRLGCRLRLTKPNAEDRLAILQLKSAKMPLDDEARLSLKAFADGADKATGADLGGLCDRAALCCLRARVNEGGDPDDPKHPLVVTKAHFKEGTRRHYAEYLSGDNKTTSPPVDPNAPTYNFM